MPENLLEHSPPEQSAPHLSSLLYLPDQGQDRLQLHTQLLAQSSGPGAGPRLWKASATKQLGTQGDRHTGQ